MAQHYRDDQYVAADGSGNVVFTFKPPNANTAITGTVAVFNSAPAALYTAEVGSATVGVAWGSWYGVSPFQVQMLGEVLIVRGSGNVAGTSYHAVLIGRADPLGQEDFTAPFSSAPVAAGGPAPGGGVTQIIAGTNITISPGSGLGAVTINASRSQIGAATAWAIGDQSAIDFTTSSATDVDITGVSGGGTHALWNLSAGGTNQNGQVSVGAVTGDVLRVELNANYFTQNGNPYVSALVGGTAFTSTSITPNVQAGALVPSLMLVMAVVTAGMISGGQVACKPQWHVPNVAQTAEIANRATANPLAPIFVVTNLFH